MPSSDVGHNKQFPPPPHALSSRRLHQLNDSLLPRGQRHQLWPRRDHPQAGGRPRLAGRRRVARRRPGGVGAARRRRRRLWRRRGQDVPHDASARPLGALGQGGGQEDRKERQKGRPSDAFGFFKHIHLAFFQLP